MLLTVAFIPCALVTIWLYLRLLPYTAHEMCIRDRNYGASQQRSDGTIIRHKRKGESKLQQPCALAVFFASKEMEHKYHDDTAPPIV